MNREHAKINDVWYRIEGELYSSCGCDEACQHDPLCEMRERKYYVNKITPKGVWLTQNPVDFNGNIIKVLDTPRWVSFNTFKQFACPNLLSAYESFLARKKAQKRILERSVQLASVFIYKATQKIEETL